eukprot:CAMPEP_0173218178 /NCGR_PEP_ID=MMETSP1142-20121109/912_1 /TAXON_ID=483371 /ORGANISM="non described non described, Strain CCMP2298" /LENGTH=35 /DNA_ID= /DNA_START= /DNA_END= /DNA_ORIENTATION=
MATAAAHSSPAPSLKNTPNDLTLSARAVVSSPNSA